MPTDIDLETEVALALAWHLDRTPDADDPATCDGGQGEVSGE